MELIKYPGLWGARSACSHAFWGSFLLVAVVWVAPKYTKRDHEVPLKAVFMPTYSSIRPTAVYQEMCDHTVNIGHMRMADCTWPVV